MKNIFISCLIVASLLATTACSPFEQKARDTAAALNGAILAAQAAHQDCITNSKQSVCDLINNGVSAQNALITAGETYCGWSTVAPPLDPNAVCVPQKNATALLSAAIFNATNFVLELKGAI